MSALDPLFLLAGSVAITSLFVAAAVHKLARMERFRAIVADYRLMPPVFASLAALAVPVLELVAAGAALAALFTGDGRLLAPAAVMLTLYAFAMAANLVRGRRHIDCGCTAFGARDVTIDWSMVARNLGMAAVILLLVAIPVHPRPLGLVDVIALAGIGVVPPFLYIAFGEWRALRQTGMQI